MSEEKKIYVVLAKKVYHPVYFKQVGKLDRWYWVHGTDTKTILQPPGRLAAQAAHVVSKMRVLEAMKEKDYSACPITTIILSVEDNFQLEFRSRLLTRCGVINYLFFDTNEDYGPSGVLTAICTVPVKPEKIYGALDYLPLWDGQ